MYKLGLYKFNFDLYNISLHHQKQKIKVVVNFITYLFDLLGFVSNFNVRYNFQLGIIFISSRYAIWKHINYHRLCEYEKWVAKIHNPLKIKRFLVQPINV